MECPVCNGGMWDNRKKKINPKAPDFRCKDEECKYSLNPDTGEYEEGEFTTGVWLKKEVEKVEKEMQRDLKPKVTHPDKIIHDDNINSMLMSYSKDFVVAQITSGKYETPFGIEDVINNYEKMKQAL